MDSFSYITFTTTASEDVADIPSVPVGEETGGDGQGGSCTIA